MFDITRNQTDALWSAGRPATVTSVRHLLAVVTGGRRCLDL